MKILNYLKNTIINHTLNNKIDKFLFSALLICSTKEAEKAQTLSPTTKIIIGSAVFLITCCLTIFIIGYLKGDSSGGTGPTSTDSLSSIKEMATVDDEILNEMASTVNDLTQPFDDGAGVFPRMIDPRTMEVVSEAVDAAESVRDILT